MSGDIELTTGDAEDVPHVVALMTRAFEPRFGEAWNVAQTFGVLTLPGARLVLARSAGRLVGFALTRQVLDELELMLIAVEPLSRGRGLGSQLLDDVLADARGTGARRVHLEMRKGNSATLLYSRRGFTKIGERPRYYRGQANEMFDAETFVLSFDRD